MIELKMHENHDERQLTRPADAVSRRSVARGVLGSGLVAVLLAPTGRNDARAQSTPVVTFDDSGPLRYVLKGGETEITFVPMKTGSTAQFDYRTVTETLSFTGDEIELASGAPLGNVASVLVETVADGYVRYLTLLVPEVNRDEEQLDVPMSTLAILTTHLTSIAGPALVDGALQTYDALALDGVAEFGPK